MPIIIECPDCSRKLRVPDDLLGKKVRCPGCKVMFKATTAGDGEEAEVTIKEPEEKPVPRRKASARDDRISDSPRSRRRSADEDDEEEEERGSSVRDKKAGWNKVRIGINLVMIGIWIWVGGIVVAALCYLLSGALFAGGVGFGLASTLLIIGWGLVWLCGFVEWVLRLVGYGMCMFAPPKRDSGLRPLSITACGLLTASTAFILLTFVIALFSLASVSRRNFGGIGGFGMANTLLTGTSGLCAIASFIVFLLFLRSVCNNIRARHLAGQPIAIMIAFISFWLGSAVLLGIVLAILGSMRGRAGGIIFVVLVGLLGLAYLGLNVWYVSVLQKIREEVASYRREL